MHTQTHDRDWAERNIDQLYGLPGTDSDSDTGRRLLIDRLEFFGASAFTDAFLIALAEYHIYEDEKPSAALQSDPRSRRTMMDYKFLEKPYSSVAELNLAIAQFWLSDWPPRRRAMLAEATDEAMADETIDILNLDGRRDGDKPALMREGPLPGLDRKWLINAFRLIRAKQAEADAAKGELL